jgi:exodeoxyribonuclease VII large subunit
MTGAKPTPTGTPASASFFIASSRLAGVAARLSPGLLTRSAAEAQRRLDRARLAPALIERPLRDGTARLAALTRVMSQLHPEKPLERGYAIIRTAAGTALTTRAQAADAALLTLQFRDGVLPVAPFAGALPPRPSAPAPAPVAPRKRAAPAAPPQDDLFG